MNNENKKAYATPQVLDFGTLQEVVLNKCGTGEGDKGTVDVGDDSGWVAEPVEEISY